MSFTQQAIDKDALLRRCMGAADFAQSIVNQFLDNWERDYRILEECVGRAIENQETDDLTRHAHRLKGTASTIGADVLAEEFQKIESIRECPDEESLRAGLTRLQLEIERIAEFAEKNL